MRVITDKSYLKNKLGQPDGEHAQLDKHMREL